MHRVKLFFATNRKHQGKDQWNPKGYGKTFSADGLQNLRFGVVKIQVNDTTVSKHLHKKVHSNRGDGEALAEYLAKASKKGSIKAYEDWSASAKTAVQTDTLASTQMFKDIKKQMDDAADVVIFLHGYNVDWDHAVGSALSLQYMLNRKRQDGEKEVVVVLFSWPSDGSIMPYVAYKSDRVDAAASAQAMARALLKLRDFLLTLWKGAQKQELKLCNRELHLLCHSMGNYVLQNALGKFAEHATGGRLARLFSHVFLCAADVPDAALEVEQEMGNLHELCKYITVYYNSGDVGLFISDHTKGNTDRLGHGGNAHPYLVHNKVHQVNCSKVVEGFIEHSYYLWGTVNDDIRQSVDDWAFDDAGRKRKRQGHAHEWVLTE